MAQCYAEGHAMREYPHARDIGKQHRGKMAVT
ncbi:hypothetical protein F4827_006903 [Paraburkholderia bannensis]|uniref:Uncharacterized protein n=1 Tax=Paraburkholderia bannensis TaxID=765414 RepID=A0A7W9WXA1_9BURK|nr:hypothetical protein [Paraburkholderia sp. WP4_3_2]MBB6107023.1 hypothetical protein [Paraburkholderia bannensis]